VLAVTKRKAHDWGETFAQERGNPALRIVLDALTQFEAQLAETRVQVERLDGEAQAAAEELARAEISGASSGEITKLETALRRVKEQAERAHSRAATLETMIPGQAAQVRSAYERIIAGIREAYAPPYRDVIHKMAATARQMARLVVEEAELREAAVAQLRRAARGAGKPPETIGTGLPAMGGAWEEHVGTLRDPNSVVRRWLNAAQEQGYDVGGDD
jgi:hypothetical protein